MTFQPPDPWTRQPPPRRPLHQRNVLWLTVVVVVLWLAARAIL